MIDFYPIRQSLLTRYAFTEQELMAFEQRLIRKTIPKKKLLLNIGETSDGISFVLNGSLRLFTRTDEADTTLHFFTENTWAADLGSLLSQQPSNNGIEAIETTTIAHISLYNMHQLMDSYPNFKLLHGLLAELNIVSRPSSKSPDERYQTLLKQHPDWIKRFAQKQLASYLAMTPETLSRVRSRMD